MKEEAQQWLKENRSDVVLVEDGWGGGCNAKSRFRCVSCGHVWSTHFYCIKKGSGCPQCANRQLSLQRSGSLEQAVVFLEKNKKDIDILSWGGGNKKRSTYKCRICGYVWESTFRSFVNGSGCPNCANIAISKKKSMTEEEAVNWLVSRNVPISILKWGGGSNKKSRVKCSCCGYEWGALFANIKRGRRCPVCSKKELAEKLATTVEDATLWLQQHGRHMEIIRWGGTAISSSEFRCLLCGRVWKSTFMSIKRSKKGCVCGRRYSESDAVSKLEETNSTIHLIEWGGMASKESMFRCSICGHVWKKRLSSVLYGCGCPACNRNGKRYVIDNNGFDSSWEAISFLYHQYRGDSVIRPVFGDKTYSYCYLIGSRLHRAYPDLIVNEKIIEIKPENGGRYDDERERTEAKKIAHPDILWYNEKDIEKQKKWLIARGIDVEAYRVL